MGYIRKALEKGYSEHLRSACCTDDMFEIFVHFGRCLCCLLPLFRWLAGAYALSSDHLDQHKKPVLIRDHKMKWLDFGTTPDDGNLSPHPGFVWMKAGYSESIEWRKVRLTKQQNVDPTTGGLWAMLLNSGWVPVKSRRLQDWQKLKKYVPNNEHGDVCPNGVPALPEKDNANDDWE